MRISELYNKFSGAVYVVGSGPSMDVFPVKMLEDKTCCMLNDTQKHFPQLGPIAFANNRSFLTYCNLKYKIVKGRLKHNSGAESRTDNHVAWDDPDKYVFSYREPVINGVSTGDEWSHFNWKKLWEEPDFLVNEPGGNVAIFAMQALIQMGFTEIYLVGCDCMSFGRMKDYHKGKRLHRVKHDYEAYRRGGLRMIREGRKRGVSIMTLTPFAGLGHELQQFAAMSSWGDKKKDK